MTTAPHPEGPWEPLHCIKAETGWDDCCPFFDEDGKIYFVATNFADTHKTYLYELSSDGKTILEDTKVLINQDKGREANKLYKIGRYYYHFYSEHTSATGRYIMMQRSKQITGPYSEKRQLSYAQKEINEPNQGGLLDTPDGRWYFLAHHGTGDWSGRITSLIPVHWTEEWPIIGEPDDQGIGTMIWSAAKPLTEEESYSIQTSDSFSGSTLSVQWEWNYQPRKEKWSLTERPGYLRLYGFRPLEKDNLLKAGNTLTQRSFRTPKKRSYGKDRTIRNGRGVKSRIMPLLTWICPIGSCPAKQ